MPPTPAILRLREALQSVEAEHRILKGEEERLRKAIAAYQTRLENTPQREQELQDLSRDYDITRELYHTLVKNHDAAMLAETARWIATARPIILTSTTPSSRGLTPSGSSASHRPRPGVR